MLKLTRFIRGKALVFAVIGVVCIMAAAYFDAQQPTFLNDAITSLQGNHWWGDNGWYWKDGGSSLFFAFWPAIIMMSIYASSSLLLGVTGAFMGSAASLFAARNTRYEMYKKIQTYSFSEVDKISTASIITRLSNDLYKYQFALQMILTMLFRAPITFIISIINAYTPPLGNAIYGSITVGIVALMLIVVTAIGLRVLPTFIKAQKKLDATNTIMRENILGARVIKAFNIQDKQYERYEKENKELKKLNIRGQALMLPIMSIIQFILTSGSIVILLVAGIQFKNHGTPINGGIFAFAQLLVIVLFSALIAVMVIVIMARTLASVKRINEIFNLQPSIVDDKEAINLNNDYSIKFDHVTFKYNSESKLNVLDDINFEIESGKTLGIVGGTGSGKTTIASLLPRFYDVNEGHITIGGIDIKKVKQDDLIDKMGVVLQESILFSGTIESNLRFGKPTANADDIKQACDDACAWDFISKMPDELNSIVEQRGRNFSGGQKQRLSIARTLIKKPKILVLDDTTSALDLLTEARVQENLKKKYSEATKIIISQRIASVKNADKIIVIDSGKIIGEGTHESLIKNNLIYREIVESQLGQKGVN